MSWNNVYNQKKGMIIIASKKHEISIKLRVSDNGEGYCWELWKIEEFARKK